MPPSRHTWAYDIDIKDDDIFMLLKQFIYARLLFSVILLSLTGTALADNWRVIVSSGVNSSTTYLNFAGDVGFPQDYHYFNEQNNYLTLIEYISAAIRRAADDDHTFTISFERLDNHNYPRPGEQITFTLRSSDLYIIGHRAQTGNYIPVTAVQYPNGFFNYNRATTTGNVLGQSILQDILTRFIGNYPQPNDIFFMAVFLSEAARFRWVADRIRRFVFDEGADGSFYIDHRLDALVHRWANISDDINTEEGTNVRRHVNIRNIQALRSVNRRIASYRNNHPGTEDPPPLFTLLALFGGLISASSQLQNLQ